MFPNWLILINLFRDLEISTCLHSHVAALDEGPCSNGLQSRLSRYYSRACPARVALEWKLIVSGTPWPPSNHASSTPAAHLITRKASSRFADSLFRLGKGPKIGFQPDVPNAISSHMGFLGLHSRPVNVYVKQDDVFIRLRYQMKCFTTGPARVLTRILEVHVQLLKRLSYVQPQVVWPQASKPPSKLCCICVYDER